ncbi:hypothetical protein E3N88_03064 [Mikania micrantha]|uniref:Ubiquitin-like protease family profile domain-containing protein n=1 Tax=Mikania micrantha TaxID=192012 RepID=A0A5N6Q7U6_9ASTR|nr:hypothetical protein E3N88_03064 [Mikania micrantha]
MAHNRGKEVVDDEEYHSQPAPKASKWIFQKWRRQPKETSENASSSNPPEDKTEKIADDLEEIPQKKRNWAIPNEDSNKWSQDVVEFYNNGDAPFCYSIFFKDKKLDGDFWGTLLGYRCNGQLWPMHIEGWVTRMMHFRDARLRTNGPSGLRWTILPPEFRDLLILKESKFAAVYANGTHELYPPWWEVDYIYIPLCIRNVGDWYLVRINLQTMELVQYWPNKGYIKDYRSLIHFPTMDVLPIKFDWLLDEIQYWRKYDGVYIDKRDRHLKVHNANDDYAPKDGGDLGGDTGVLACMLMQHLVQNKNLNVDDDFKNKCMKYRRYMAEQYYNWRFIPRG